MPVTHGVTGSSPVRTADILLHLFEVGYFFVFLRMAQKGMAKKIRLYVLTHTTLFFNENRLFQILFQGREDSFSTKVSVDDNAIRINHERSGDGAYVIVFSYFAVANTLQVGQVEPFYIVFITIEQPKLIRNIRV